MRAEFGFTLHEMALGIGELVALADERHMTEPCKATLAEVRARLSSELGWSSTTIDSFLDALTLKARASFLSVGVEAYPWRFNRKFSYPRRPIIQVDSATEGPMLLWGVRRLWDAGSYYIDLVYSGRLHASSAEMKRVGGTVRQGHNKAFEEQVEQALAAGGCDYTAHSLARIDRRKLESEAGEDLGDIDALGVDVMHRMIFVGEAKDFEIARTPAEMSNEADSLVRGEKSASLKTARRAQWVKENVPHILAHFGIKDTPRGWSVEPLIVTSRDLISPRVLTGDVPVMAISDVEAWMAGRVIRRQRGRHRTNR